jgi:DNA-binding transcriptional regulator LsrR (DeoR family)
LQIAEMFYEDGMKEAEIAESMGISELAVHEVLAAFEENGKPSLIERLADMEIIEMYCEDGMEEADIAKATGYPLSEVRKVLTAYEESDLIVDTYHKRDEGGV